MAHDELVRLRDRFGIEALAWLLASEVDGVRSWTEGRSEPGAAATEAIRLLTEVVRIASAKEQPEVAIAQFLATASSDEEPALGAQIRSAAGGDLCAPTSDDPIARCSS
jgi:hypothetical protein